MAKELKRIICGHLKSRYQGLQGCVLVDYRGLNSEQTQDLRASLRKNGVTMNVIQNRLARRALAEAGTPKDFQELLRGPTAVLYAEDGAIVASRSIRQWQRKNKDVVKIKGGLFQGKAINAAQVERLATIPDQDTLRSHLAALLVHPATVLATAVQSVLSQFAGAVQSRRDDPKTAAAGGA